MMKQILESYARTQVTRANYGLFHLISSGLASKTSEMGIFEIKELLESCRKLKYSNVTLLNSVNRRIFSYINSPDSEMNQIEG